MFNILEMVCTSTGVAAVLAAVSIAIAHLYMVHKDKRGRI